MHRRSWIRKIWRLSRVCWKTQKCVKYEPSSRSCIDILRGEDGEVVGVLLSSQTLLSVSARFLGSNSSKLVFALCIFELETFCNVMTINCFGVFQQTLSTLVADSSLNSIPSEKNTNRKRGYGLRFYLMVVLYNSTMKEVYWINMFPRSKSSNDLFLMSQTIRWSAIFRHKVHLPNEEYLPWN